MYCIVSYCILITVYDKLIATCWSCRGADQYGTIGFLDWLHSSNRSFKNSINYKRHFTISFIPVDVLVKQSWHLSSMHQSTSLYILPSTSYSVVIKLYSPPPPHFVFLIPNHLCYISEMEYKNNYYCRMLNKKIAESLWQWSKWSQYLWLCSKWNCFNLVPISWNQTSKHEWKERRYYRRQGQQRCTCTQNRWQL